MADGEEGFEILGLPLTTDTGNSSGVVDLEERVEVDVDEDGWRAANPQTASLLPLQHDIFSESEDEDGFGKISWQMDTVAVEHCLATVGLS